MAIALSGRPLCSELCDGVSDVSRPGRRWLESFEGLVRRVRDSPARRVVGRHARFASASCNRCLAASRKKTTLLSALKNPWMLARRIGLLRARRAAGLNAANPNLIENKYPPRFVPDVGGLYHRIVATRPVHETPHYDLLHGLDFVLPLRLLESSAMRTSMGSCVIAVDSPFGPGKRPIIPVTDVIRAVMMSSFELTAPSGAFAARLRNTRCKA